jgi:hypothetical protein
MHRRAAGPLFAAAALLAGCEPATAPQTADFPSTGSISAASLTPASPIRTLAGEWRVAGIDGEPFDEAYGLALSGDARTIRWEPRCAGFVRGYRIEGDRIVVGPDPDAPLRQPGKPTRPVCTIAPPARLAEVMRALDAAGMVRRTPSNGVELAGGGRSLLLFSQ